LNKLIEVADLNFTYRAGSGNEVRALRGVNLDIFKGEFLAITGQNGSGKSTLARHFNGLLIPKSGAVLINGLSSADKKNIPAIRKSVGMVFQNPDNQLVSSIVEEDIAFGPENLGLPADLIRKRVDWALHTLSIETLRRESPMDLSEGQKQLVAIAGVLAMKPECIVLDEPTAHLDPRSRREVIENIVFLNSEEKITIILLTHFMNEVVYSNRMCVMDCGEIKLVGSPRELFSSPESIEKLGLDLPIAARLAAELNSRGLTLPGDIISAEELVDQLCLLK
jgi:energy-coupling factor transport system ATP-binding protein